LLPRLAQGEIYRLLWSKCAVLQGFPLFSYLIFPTPDVFPLECFLELTSGVNIQTSRFIKQDISKDIESCIIYCMYQETILPNRHEPVTIVKITFFFTNFMTHWQCLMMSHIIHSNEYRANKPKFARTGIISCPLKVGYGRLCQSQDKGTSRRPQTGRDVTVILSSLIGSH